MDDKDKIMNDPNDILTDRGCTLLLIILFIIIAIIILSL